MEAENLWGKLILILVLTAVNAFFASAEMAIVAFNRNKVMTLAEEGNKKAKTLLKVTEDQTKFLSTIQVGITLAGFFSSGSAATSISVVLSNKLAEYGIPYSGAVGFVVVTVILSYLTLVFGELVPKRIALQNAEKVALRSANMIKLFSKIAKPFVKLLSVSTTAVLKMLGKYSEQVEEKISEEEIKSYIKVGQEQGVINPSGEEMMISIMDFDDKLAYEIMTPRINMYMVDYDEFSEKTIPEILEKGFSRIPVYKDSIDNVVGLITVKDIFREYCSNRYRKLSIDEVMKDVYYTPKTKNIDVLLTELQNTQNYVAILIDEYGGVSGMVTVEDIVEEIVGEIEDEYDRGIGKIVKVDSNTYIADGHLELDYINNELDTDLDSENYETISGLTIELLGFIPEDGDPHQHAEIYNNKYMMTGVGVKGKKFKKVEIKIIENGNNGNGRKNGKKKRDKKEKENKSEE